MAIQSTLISKTSLLNLIFTALCAISFSLHAETRDFNQIKTSKTLRIITWSGTDNYLPRAGSPPKAELDYLQQFADENKLEVELVTLNKFDELIPALLAGKGDVIAANLSVTQQRKRRVMFTSSFAKTIEYLVMAKDAKTLHSGKALAGRELVVQEGTAYELTAQGLVKFHPELKIRTIPWGTKP